MATISTPNMTTNIIQTEEKRCVVSWAAIIGGALTAAAVSLVLLILGSAYGLSTVSPWSSPETITSITAKTAIWLIVMQWAGSGIGGYLAGRLRNPSVATPLDEVFFRDTAHGFLTWVVATLLTATILASTVATITGGGVKAAAFTNAARPAPESDRTGYAIDTLFRSNTPNAAVPAPEARMEATRIFVLGLKDGALTPEDKNYLTQVVAARTGLDQAAASQRVDNVLAKWNATKEEARKNAMHAALYIALSMVVGAFIASATAALGGRHRDEPF